MAPLLEVQGVSKRFGGLQALREVGFAVEPGSIHAVIGPNGAGKTTLFNLVSGFAPADEGAVTFRGERVERLPAHALAARGMSRTFQHIRLFAGMTALENVMVGRHAKGGAGLLAGMFHAPWTWRAERETRERAREALAFLGAEGLAASDALSLSYGQQRAVELARALCGEPALLLLDEPAAGLNMRETADLAALIGRIRGRGVTVLLVEHDVPLVMGLCDRVTVLDAGRRIADGPPAAVQRDPEVVRVYLGEEEEPC